MNKRYIVDLTADERTGLLALLNAGVAPARRLTRARILLLADEGGTDQGIAAALHVHAATVERTRRRFVEGGVERALSDQPRPGGRPKLDGKQEAHLVALACSAPPEGRTRWTLRLLAERLVELEVVDTVSYETVRQALQQTG
jgi:transposase